MSYYVKRAKISQSVREQRGHTPIVSRQESVGWVGPIRSEKQAHREAKAWVDSGWAATVYVSTPVVRAEVRAWVKSTRSRIKAANVKAGYKP